MDFSFSRALRELQETARCFISKAVRTGADHSPEGPPPMGGMGPGHMPKALVFEEAGYSWLGPTALNIHAPDEGNILLMEEVAIERRKERRLRPQVAGRPCGTPAGPRQAGALQCRFEPRDGDLFRSALGGRPLRADPGRAGGVTAESAVMRVFTDMRAFRIYHGPSELHRWSMARKIVSAAGAAA